MDILEKVWPFMYGIAFGVVNFYFFFLIMMFVENPNRLSSYPMKGIKIALIMAIFLTIAEILLISSVSRLLGVQPSMTGFILGFCFSYAGNLKKYAKRTFEYIVEHFKFD